MSDRRLDESLLLRRHIDYLLSNDKWFRDAWSEWGIVKRETFLRKAVQLDHISRDDDCLLAFEKAHRALRRLFVVVPERDLDPSAVKMASWIDFATNENAKRDVLKAAWNHFNGMFAPLIRRGVRLQLYGSLKDLESIHQVPTAKLGGSGISRTIGDLWDIVRFRAVVEAPEEVISLSLQVWDHHLDDVVKVRNYYFNPRPSQEWPSHPYRAVHFQVPILDAMVELQVMTASCEVICYLDHAMLFKKRLEALDRQHYDWLSRMRFAGLVLEHRGWHNCPDSASSMAHDAWRASRIPWYRRR